jgi:predicted phage baseplate assembly protein
MTLAIPKLDDRQFQDIVDEAKKRIPQFCPEWTDHNVSDPGVTLIELFAWMTDLILYRLNQVPELHYVKFLEMLGITLSEPVPASAPVTFWLSKPQETPVTIPIKTEIASTQTETEPSIVFTTDHEFRIDIPQLRAVTSRVTSQGKGKKRYREHPIRQLEVGHKGSDVFSAKPEVDDALYFGFENDLSNHILRFELEYDEAYGAGIKPELPPYSFEVSADGQDDHWQPCYKESDTTKGMNQAGYIQIQLPKMSKCRVDDQDYFWVRARVKDISPFEQEDGMEAYEVSPRLRKVSVASWGGTVFATHAQQITKEFIGRSDGTPGQRFHLQMTPVLKRNAGENLTVQMQGEPPKPWREVPDFSDSGAEDRHYTLDSVTGELCFGPAIRQPDGTMKLYGAIPSRGANLVFDKYRYGGGQDGNVEAGILNTLKTAIPYISRVENRESAWGGLDGESLEAAKMRAPALLHSRQRAVTEGDYEFLARQALPAAIGRVKCLQPLPSKAGRVDPGQVYVLVIPRIPHPEERLEPDQLELRQEDIAALSAYLDERRLLTTHLDIRPPAYHWVSVTVKLRHAPGIDRSEVESNVLARLYQFLNPLVGGSNDEGWPFGRDLFVSDVYQCLQGMQNVQFVRGVEMFPAEPGGGPEGDPVEVIEVVAHGVVASGVHQVEFV